MKHYSLVSIWIPLLAWLLASSALTLTQAKRQPGVTYDGTSFIVNGRRELLFSGSIHYPRSTPDMWPHIIRKAKQGGLNVIQTYVFWNVHEPVQGNFNFSGQFDLVKFIKLIEKNNLYVCLRLGPFIQAEWNHGGLPYWLREIPGMVYRTDNEPFKKYTEKYVKTVMDKMKEEKLFASQGGPIILAQIENEYTAVQKAYKEKGNSYVQWAAKMAVSQNVGVPWIMCKQNDAPDPMINACNGRHCGDTFPGPNTPDKPSIWTENWTAQFRVFGDPPSQRSAEDIAFSVARFFSKNGTHVNYYMYHGGTNFGRTSAHFVTTRYYDEAPLDEYGLAREPKYSHLKHLHSALGLCKKALLWGTPKAEILAPKVEARYYEQPGNKVCAAFLANNNTKVPAVIKFRGREYTLPPRSISILPDCKTVVLNTAQIVGQHSSRNFVRSKSANKKFKFKMFTESIPSNIPGQSHIPAELYGLTKDRSDYAWYLSSVELSEADLPKEGKRPVLRVGSLGHALHVFLNGEYIGKEHGQHDQKSFAFEKAVNLQVGNNHIAIAAVLTGFPDSGAFMEKRYAGPRDIKIKGLPRGILDMTEHKVKWGHKVGLEGEELQLYTSKGAKKITWKNVDGRRPPFSWYKTHFDEPEGSNTVVVRMNGMGKGLIWVNGNNIGRYWMSFLSPIGFSSQAEYHIPRSWLRPKKNLLVIFEEEPGVTPEAIEFLLVDRDTICAYVGDNYPPSVKFWHRSKSEISPLGEQVQLMANLKCYDMKQIVAVEFASFGNPFGSCGSYSPGDCNAPASKQIVEKFCLGKTNCSIPVNTKTFAANETCPGFPHQTLAVQFRCGHM